MDASKQVEDGIRGIMTKDEKRDRNQELEKNRLEFLFNVIAETKDIKVTFDEKGPLSNLKEREIILNPKEEFGRKKSEGFQELGHIWLSGSLENIYQNWNAQKHGKFEDFKWLINALEDLRTENLMSIRYPQIKNRLTNLHIEKINNLLEKNPDYRAEHPLVAAYIHAEDRFEIPIEINEKIKGVSDKIKELIKSNSFKDGNWKNLVGLSLSISEEIKKWEEDRFRDLKEQLEQMKNLSSEADQKIKDLVLEEGNQLSKILSSQKSSRSKEKEIKGCQEFIDRLKSQIKESKSDEFKELLKEYIEGMDKIEQRKSHEKLMSEEEITKIKKYMADLSQIQQKIYEKIYKPSIEKQTKLAGKIAEMNRELAGNINHLPSSFVHHFEKIKEKNPGSELTKGDIEVMLEGGESSEEEKDEEKSRIQFGIPLGSEIVKDRPIVKTTTLKDRFSGEGYHNIIDLPLALSMGHDIASTLKRELKLKAVVLKKRMSGTLDIKAVKRQIAKYGQIIDPRVMKIRRDIVEKHSILVLVDFSGSMGSRYNPKHSKLQYAKQALVTLGRTLEELDVKYSLRGFSATTGKFQICDIVMKGFDEMNMDYKLINKVFYPSNGREDNCQNRDGSSIRHASDLLSRERGKKLLIVISDGIPSHPSDRDTYAGQFGKEDTKLAVIESLQKGIKIMGVSIDPNANNFVLEAYPNSFVFNDLNKLPFELTNTYIKAIMGR